MMIVLSRPRGTIVGVLGRPSAWLRWLFVLALAIVGARLGMYLLAPRMPEHFGWAGALMLGFALVFLVMPFPHEALFAHPADDGTPDADGGGRRE